MENLAAFLFAVHATNETASLVPGGTARSDAPDSADAPGARLRKISARLILSAVLCLVPIIDLTMDLFMAITHKSRSTFGSDVEFGKDPIEVYVLLTTHT